MGCFGQIGRGAKACLVASLAASLVFGCAGPATRNNSLSFQDGQGLSNEQILLRNIVEAAHDKTPTFVAANSVTSQAKIDARLGANFTIPDIGHVLSPEVGGAREQSVSILDYGATKAAQHLYNAVPIGIARQLLVQGWPSQLMETVLFALLYVHPELNELISHKAQRVCDTTSDRGKIDLCRWNENIVRECSDPIGAIAYPNHAQSACSFFTFQVLLNKLELTDTAIRVGDRERKDKDGNPVTEQRLYEVFGDRQIEALYYKLAQQRAEGDPPIFGPLLRSPAQIIEFLGRLAALQLYGDRPVVARVPILRGGYLEWMIPFRVVRGGPLGEPSAVSVRVGGERYNVPGPYAPSQYRDQSVKVMSLVIELQNRARQEAPIQGAAIAILQ